MHGLESNSGIVTSILALIEYKQRRYDRRGAAQAIGLSSNALGVGG